MTQVDNLRVCAAVDPNSRICRECKDAADTIERLQAEIAGARSHAFNLIPDRTTADARDDLNEQIDVLGRRYLAYSEDTALLNWIDQHGASVYSIAGRFQVEWPNRRSFVYVAGITIRETINAARREEAK